MGDDTEIGPHTKVINLENYDQHQLLEYLRKVDGAIGPYLRSRESLIKEFPGFKELRLPNIQTLRRLADKLDGVHRDCNIATIVGASAGILGGLTAISGLVMLTVVTGGAAAPLLAAAPAIATAGGVTATAGGLTSFGTFVTKGIIEKVKLDKINKLLEEDKAYFERVFPFVQRTTELRAAVEELMNFSAFQNMVESFGNNPEVINAIKEEQPMQKLPQGMKDSIDSLPVCVNQKQRMMDMLHDIMGSQEGIRLFRRIFVFFRRVSPFIKITFKFYNAAAEAFHVADTSFNAGNAVVTLVKSAKPATVIVAAFGALSAIAVAIDVVVLVLKSIDMVKGSRSQLAVKVRNAAELLQKELNTLNQIYCALLKRNDPKTLH